MNINAAAPSFSGLYKVDLKNVRTERQFYYYAKAGFNALNKDAVHKPLITKQLDKEVILAVPDRNDKIVEGYLKMGRVKFEKLA